MSPKRIKQRFEDFQRAVKRLDEALKEDVSKSSTIMDGTIQRFEFTYELGWKLIKDILDYQGVGVKDGPRSYIKKAFEVGLIKDGDGWISMLEDRNKSSHIYDETQILEIYQAIKSSYYSLLNNFQSKVLEVIEEIK